MGFYFPTGAVQTGYSYDIQTRTFAKISFAGIETQPSSINNDGTIVGTVFQSNNISFPAGFELIGGNFQKVVPNDFPYSYLNGISNTGDAVGCSYSLSGCVQPFLLSRGKLRRLKLPADSRPYGINSSGAIRWVSPIPLYAIRFCVPERQSPETHLFGVGVD
jgi:hypothetical protein